MNESAPHLMTVPEAAAFLRISPDLAYELIRRKELPAVRLGRVIRVPRFALEQWVRVQAGASTEMPMSPPGVQQH